MLIDAEMGMLELALPQISVPNMRRGIQCQLDVLSGKLNGQAVAALVRSITPQTSPSEVSDILMARCAREWLTGMSTTSPLQMWQVQHGVHRQGPTAVDLAQWRAYLRTLLNCPGLNHPAAQGDRT